MVSFTTEIANTTYLETFETPARAILSQPEGPATNVYQSLGRLWAQTHRALETLSAEEAHHPEPGDDLGSALRGMVQDTLEQIWKEKKPKIGDTTLGNRSSSIDKAYRESYRAALARTAADRAAAGPAPTIPMTPSAAGGAQSLQETAPEQHQLQDHAHGGADLIDMLMSRMPGTPTAPNPVAPLPTSGNGTGTTAQRAAAVPPELVRATTRLTGVGCPPLRVDKVGAQLAVHILLNKDTFTQYVENRTLTGGQEREALTLARALDLGTVEFGSRFLVSSAAEVMLRRLVSLLLGIKMGNFKLSTFLEEVPGDSALDCLPDAVLKGLQERMKLEVKITQLGK